ncbi:putative metallophosphoesterase [Pirellulimonas nuda]|uniref:Putative metallophosphoesterase n=1 Tax=Pirellulimonas nuda TaxID=2528009 RepID=A0A518DHH3_9BACT|nr:metallophosphoesterase [Pirellulimonas nuda]QDU90892.1 putative metallophosphoesterase [Pirellulimonas nuda]
MPRPLSVPPNFASPAVPVNRRQFLRRAGKVLAVGSLGAAAYAWRLEPQWIEVVERPMPIAGLPGRLEGKTLVQLSDLHVGPVVDQRYLERAMGIVESMSPDVIVVTGDLMTCDGPEYAQRAADTVSLLRPDRRPVIAIPGNHDYGHGSKNPVPAEALGDALQQHGVRWLLNQCEEVHGLQVAGTDDLWARRIRVRETLGLLDRNQASIVLTHNPDGLDLPAAEWDGYRGWVLCGHTHGGQLRLPGYGVVFAPIKNKRYCTGLVDLGDGRVLYVNRGLGYKARVRLGSRPEITRFHLTGKTPPPGEPSA